MKWKGAFGWFASNAGERRLNAPTRAVASVDGHLSPYLPDAQFLPLRKARAVQSRRQDSKVRGRAL
jgi:hypothetical protein